MHPLVSLFATTLILAACAPDPAGLEQQLGSSAEPLSLNSTASQLQREVVVQTNYDPSQIAVAVLPGQVVVSITNSNLLTAPHPHRDADAARIAHTLEKQIEIRADLAGVQAIHVDYYARDAGASSLKDSMDFRRDRAGRFQNDVS